MSGILAVSGSTVGGSIATRLLAAETNGLALSFSDAAFAVASGHYGSARVKDTGTPANNFNGTPYGLLTNTAPSPKLCLQSDGVYRYGPQNLFLNSAAPVTQTITLISGATYAIDITGSVTTAATGAYSGAVANPGTTAFTASSTSLTLTISGSPSGTVCVRRTPSAATYLATTGAARYALPFEWGTDGKLKGVLVEESRANLLARNRALNNATGGWTQTNVTPTLNFATAIDGQTLATKLVSTAGGTTSISKIFTGTPPFNYRLVSKIYGQIHWVQEGVLSCDTRRFP